MHQCTHIKWIIAPCLLIIAVLFAGTHAFPFSKSSGVQELTPAQLKTVLQTHKPVFLLLYAPWCGHCKALHPEYERFAKKTRGVIDVVAIDCDKHNSVGSQYNLKGFPTVIYYGTKKGLKDWKPYQGARNAAGMTGVALSLVESHHVRMVSTENLLHKALQASAQSPVRRVLALFTEKEKAPPLVQVLAYDPALKNTVPVVVFRKSSAGQLLEKFTPPSFPALAILDQHPETLEVVVQSWFEGEITYDAILSYVSRTASLPKSGETSAAKEHESKTNKAAKPGFPARLIEFNVGQMNLFCVPTAPQKKQQQPYCVVAVYEVNEDDIYGTVSQNLFHQFRNDPLVIMYTHNAELLHSLGVLSIDAPLPALAVFREGSRGVRFVTRSFVDSKDLEVRGRSFLEQLLGGEVAMTKGPNTFPKTA